MIGIDEVVTNSVQNLGSRAGKNWQGALEGLA
jgi:hypothetical protein